MNANEFYREMITEANTADSILTDIYSNGYKIPEDKANVIAEFCEKSNALCAVFDEYEGEIRAATDKVMDGNELSNADIISNLAGCLKESAELLESYTEPQTDGETLNIDTITQDVRGSYEAAVDNRAVIEEQMQGMVMLTPDEKRLDEIINKVYEISDYTEQNLSYDKGLATITLEVPSETFNKQVLYGNSVEAIHKEIDSFDVVQCAEDFYEDDHFPLDGATYTREDAESDARITETALKKLDETLYKAEAALDKQITKSNPTQERD